MLAGFQTLAKALDLAHRSLDFYMGQIRGRQHQCSICHFTSKKSYLIFVMAWHFLDFFGMFFSSGVYFICFIWGWLICLSVACNFRCVLFWVAN